MAWAYEDADQTIPVAVPSLPGLNYWTCFQGGITINAGSGNATSTTSAGVTITGGLAVQGDISGDAVYGTVWNDLADCIIIPDKTQLEFGYAYCFDGQNYKKAERYLDDGFIGIHSDTAGFLLGYKPNYVQLHAAVAGFVLAYVDQEYKSGTPLTITENGYLTAIKAKDIPQNYHKIIATFWKPEPEETWGPSGQEVLVNGRMWVKVR